MVCIDLAELPSIFQPYWLWSASWPAPAWFRRADHLGDPKQSLDDCVRAVVEDRTGTRPMGRIMLLTHLRYFGYCMNPVSFYFCWDANNTRLSHVVAEVNNTPWGEQHCYVMTYADGCDPDRQVFEFDKAFHVSPFMRMNQRYRWRFSHSGDVLQVMMESLEDGERVFSASLNLHARALNSTNLRYCLLHFPFMTIRVVTAIYWQAACLWLKGVRFISHPSSTNTSGENS